MKKFFLCIFAIFLLIYIPKNALAATLLYSESNVQTITSGVTYEESKRLYTDGWKDVYVLTVDITNPNVSMEVLTSQTEYGLKKSTENLAIENSAIAAINGDFFGSGNPLSAMGQIAENGTFREARNYYNSSSSQYAGVFLDTFGNVFIDYVESNLRLYNSKVNLDLDAKNKVTSFSKPVIFDSTAISTTADLDKRNSNLYKVVVEDGVITQKLGPGEVATVPENGYVIVMDKDTASEQLAKFEISDTITFTESYEFLFRPEKLVSQIVSGMSAGGEILRNGVEVSSGYSVSPNTLQPRTAVGVSQDKTKLILMVVDGRGSSKGATHSQMAELLLEYGAYDAIHFDGGGSSTMVVRQEGDTEVSVVNNVSEGTQRSVPNALGIKTTNETGELDSIKISLNTEDGQAILQNQTYSFEILGYDSNLNPVTVDINSVKVSFLDEDDGVVNQNYFSPSKVGTLTLLAEVENTDIKTTLEIEVKDGISSIKPKLDKTSLKVGESLALSAVGANKDGYEVSLNSSDITWTIDNEDIAYISNNNLIATGEGVLNLMATYGSYSFNITIAIGETVTLTEDFETQKDLLMLYYPDTDYLAGSAVYTNASAISGNSLAITYAFKANKVTSQATYVSFERSPITFSGSPSSIQMAVKGDGSGNMLKAVLKDAGGNQYTVSIIDSMTEDNWIIASFDVPDGALYPISIEKIYVGTYSTTSQEQGTIYIDNIEAVYEKEGGGEITAGYKDYLYSDTLSTTAKTDGEEDINVFGQTADKPFSNSSQVLIDTVNSMQQDATSLIFVGDSDLSGISLTVPTVQWQNKYSTTNTQNLSIINLATKSGNMLAESSEQWKWLQGYLQSFSKNNILICMDKNIWDSENCLTGVRENELLHKILKQFVEETGKNVIVVSAVGDKSDVYVKDGVRYITLNGLTSNSETDLTNYKYLKIRATETDLQYQICNVYND